MKHAWLLLVIAAAACREPFTIPDRDPAVGSAKPFASPNAGSTYAFGETVQLDATGSFDPDGTIASYRWMVIARPSGSSANPANADAAMTTFLPDIRGRYEILLTVEDDDGQADIAMVDFEVRGKLLAVDAGSDKPVPWSKPVQLGGAVTPAPGFTPTCGWVLEARPFQSTAALQGAASLTPSFMADREGDYDLALTCTVGDETLVDRVKLTSVVDRRTLGTNAYAYAYSTFHDRLIALYPGNKLASIDPLTTAATTMTLALPDEHVGLELDATGQNALLYSGTTVSFVSLASLQVTRSVAIPTPPSNCVFAASAYCVPDNGTFDPIVSVNPSTGAVAMFPSPVSSPHAALGRGGTELIITSVQGIPEVHVYRLPAFTEITSATIQDASGPAFFLTNAWFLTALGLVVTRDTLAVRADLDAYARTASYDATLARLAIGAYESLWQFNDTTVPQLVTYGVLPIGESAYLVAYDRDHDHLYMVTRRNNSDVVVVVTP